LISHNKRHGVYYTPPHLARIVLEHISPNIGSSSSMLEPSAGGGVFVKHAIDIAQHIDITAIDIDSQAVMSLSKLGIAQCVEADFLIHDFKSRQYDLIVGNPPYISWRNMCEPSRELGRGIIEQEKLNIPSLNMWGLFIIRAERLLAPDGVMAFVLPSDIKETIAGGVVLKHLKNKFARIDLFDVPEGTFAEADQNTTVLVGHRIHQTHGFFSGKVCLQSNSLRSFKRIDKAFTFFSKATLPVTENDLSPLLELYHKTPKIGDICATSPGIVTAANQYFIVPKDKAIALGVASKANRIIPKGQVINGKIDISEDFFQELCDQNVGCYLFDVADEDKLSKAAIEYLEQGESTGLPNRYKMQNRSPWYRIPSVWTTECLFFKRTHVYPKLISNDADLLTTDAAYRLTLKEGITKESFLPSFYNSFTLLFAEILGRKYAGGVLELTPNEFKKLPIPYKEYSLCDYKKFKKDFNQKECINQVLQKYSPQTLVQYAPTSFAQEIDILYRSMLKTRLRN
jgi:adenine-specific DNA-methyltransferase